MVLLKLLKITTLLVTALAGNLLVMPDSFLQIFGLWVSTMLILKATVGFKPHPLKVLFISAFTVITLRLSNQALGLAAGDPEQFIVDWGVSGAPMKCGGMQTEGVVPPTHTAVCDIWSDPEQIVDQRVERVLEMTRHEAREMEDFLHVDWPDKRERAKSDDAEGMIV